MKHKESIETAHTDTLVATAGEGVDVIRSMREKIEAVLSQNKDSNRPERVTIDVPHQAPLNWLAAQRCDDKIYWSDRDGKIAVAGIGIADCITDLGSADPLSLLSDIQTKLEHAPSDMHYFGGIRFDSQRSASDDWRDFGRVRFVLPRFELSTGNEQTIFACNLMPSSDRRHRQEILDLLETIRFEYESPEWMGCSIISREDSPSYPDWSATLGAASHAFASADYEKIVLARESKFRLSQPVDPILLLKSLAARAKDCFHFCFQADNSTAFIGASPERLYRRVGRSFECEALAGTRPRGSNTTEDSELGEQLLGSEKDVREHRYVVEGLRESLDSLITSGFPEQGSSVTLRKLARVQHLIVQFRMQLRGEISDAEILKALHPTPAVGGYPRNGILNRIAELEPFDRGWYAGPVGWISRDSAEFAVAIRSGLVRGDMLSLYAGAGILRGSDVAAEWKELENKLGTFLDAVHK